MSKSMEKVINLIKRTGDKCIILDSDGEPEYVAMSFRDYEKLILGNPDIGKLSEEEMLEKINRDIAVWQASSKDDNLRDFTSLEEAIKGVKKPEETVELEENSLNQAKDQLEKDKYYFEPIE